MFHATFHAQMQQISMARTINIVCILVRGMQDLLRPPRIKLQLHQISFQYLHFLSATYFTSSGIDKITLHVHFNALNGSIQYDSKVHNCDALSTCLYCSLCSRLYSSH